MPIMHPLEPPPPPSSLPPLLNYITYENKKLKGLWPEALMTLHLLLAQSAI